MTDLFSVLSTLSTSELNRLAGLFEAGRLTVPPAPLSLSREGFDGANDLAGELRSLADQQFSVAQVSTLLRGLSACRRGINPVEDVIDLVVSGPDVGALARDTAVVVDELFSSAQASILVVGFALHEGRTVLRQLAERLDAEPNLKATLCLDISRAPGDSSRDDELVARFADRFSRREWPGQRVPNVYYDPRALAPWNEERGVLHAKCIAVDDAQVLVTSANLTVAARSRNIELGLLIRIPAIASAVHHHFAGLIRGGWLQRMPLAGER